MDSFFYFTETLIKEQPLWSIPLVFVSGILMSLTPCFYPLVPVVLGVVGVTEETSKKQGLSIGINFVLGLAFIYTLLGVLSVSTGMLFGQIAKNPFVQIGASVIFVLMGLALLDLWNFPSLFSFRVRKKKKVRFMEVFSIGALSGLVMGGCTFPVLGAILVLMAFYNDIVMGGLLLFVFSLGVGVVFILVAVFGSNILTFFKRNVKVFLGVKKVLGLFIIGIAVYLFVRGIYLL